MFHLCLKWILKKLLCSSVTISDFSFQAGGSLRILLTVAALLSNTENVRVGGEFNEPGENGTKNAEFH